MSSATSSHRTQRLKGTTDGATETCFCRGTRILTGRGEVAVEDLRAGDIVVTFGGIGAALKPIRWLGSVQLDVSRQRRPDLANPVLIRAGALGDNRPVRDLRVSPGHRLAIEGALIAASSLINGATIVQEAAAKVEYWHVELDGHDILLAEGLEAESYQDTGNRHSFNTGTVVPLHPVIDRLMDGKTPEPCLPFGEPSLPLRAQLIERAKALGWYTLGDPDPWLDVDGRRVKPLRTGVVYRFELPAAAPGVRLRSRTSRPMDISAESSDGRRLGLCLHRLTLECANGATEVSLDDDRLATGFFDVEGDVGYYWRWTDGDALLSLSDLAGGKAVTAIKIAVIQELLFWGAPASVASTDEAPLPAKRSARKKQQRG